MAKYIRLIMRALLFSLGVLIAIACLFMASEPNIPGMIVGCICAISGVATMEGFKKLVASFGPGKIEVERDQFVEPPDIQTKILAPKEKAQKQKHVRGRDVPGSDAGAFTALGDVRPVQVRPTSDPMVPMYRLDSKFRITEWNDAFSLAFDRTMEGRRGQTVLDWIYFLDNYKEVIDHGLGRFTGDDPTKWPLVDVEDMRYTSNRYGPIRATKRSYRMSHDDESYRGWLSILELTFDKPEMELRYYDDLILILNLNQMWSEYAISYDAVLGNTDVYADLMNLILGTSGNGAQLKPVPHGSRILDLGAGTGNITEKLASADKDYVIFALEKNATMLNILRAKCRNFLRQDDQAPGVIAVQQDVTSLFGLQDSYFDLVVSNNVLYALPPDGVPDCLKEVHRVLKPGGEVRITGPKTDTKLGPLFKTIKKELTRTGRFTELTFHYERVKRINEERLVHMLHRYTVPDIQQKLEEAGFTDLGWSTEKAYAGQAMLVTARKGA